MLICQVIISSGFHRTSQETLLIRFRLIFRIIKTIFPPISYIRKRPGNEHTQSIPVIFPLREKTFLHHVTVIIPVNNIPFLQFLILPRIIVRLVFYIHPTIVNKIPSPVQIYNLVIMFPLVITQIDTPVHIKILSQFGRVGRNQAIPIMLVPAHSHNHLRTDHACRI